MKDKIAIIGLGYVGLPLAVEFGKKFETIGFDIKKKRIKELLERNDATLELKPEELGLASKLTYTSDSDELSDCNIYIITVPTPLDIHKKPDLSILINASAIVGRLLNQDNIVIYESTVYPGATEEVCIPVLEKQSDLKYNENFYCGYSPERVNPGDKNHQITNIKKVTSGSTPMIAERIDALYRSIVKAGTYKASSIKVAEAAKVIENTQRDVNIALINELALIFNKLGIDTEEVLDAAESKWNFISFRPGLVGGHCIGVDPYYLTHKAIDVGYRPEMILAGRLLNDNMGVFVVQEVSKLMLQKNIDLVGADILIMGLTFKENCTDIRNSRVIDLVNEFINLESKVDVYDPWADKEEVRSEYNITTIDRPKKNNYDAIVLAVSHDEFKEIGAEGLREFGKSNHVLYDIKYILSSNEVDGRL
ncbi:Vi polysaccharide biosynthesis UDP-N-acetylglucosamine C-6 dehydrogenase TviB [Candidatus Pseudothioglobus singularis]|nr:Vi polysaccharide biosynthesis UDP-N-acetylglucosamine C-6 dehydrogenase TviB [Candidatus Pseudothioglobus singularis]